MWHKRLLIALSLILVVGGLTLPSRGSSPAEAGGSWSAWVYNSTTGQMVLVFPDGAAPFEWAFPLPPGTSSYPWSVAISRDGSYLAACLVDDAGNSSVRVYDIYGGSYVAAYIAGGPIQGCMLTRYAFSEDSTQVAFGIINHYPGEADPRPDWELFVMELGTSAIKHYLNSDMMTGLADVRSAVPAVVTFQMQTPAFPGLITLKPIWWGTEGACEYDGYIWNLTSNTVMSENLYGKVNLDFLLPNGEAVWTETDPALPQGFLEGPGCTHNVIRYSNKAGDLYTVYHDGTVLFGSTYVDDGRRIAFGSYAGGLTQWKTVARSGTVTSLPADLGNTYAVWGTLDGYVFITNPPDMSTAPEVRYHRFAGGAFPDSYVAWTGTPGQYYQIVWVNPLSGGAGLSPFPPMPVLGLPPLPTPTLPLLILPTATTPPPMPVGLFVGGRATVNTTVGDMLRVRTGPGTSFGVSFQLTAGTLVSLMEGPVAGDGLTWWRIQTIDGRSGWCVEAVMDGGSLLQTLIPAP